MGGVVRRQTVIAPLGRYSDLRCPDCTVVVQGATETERREALRWHRALLHGEA